MDLEEATGTDQNAYSLKETWEEFYSTSTKSSFEWYTSWPNIRKHVLKYLTCSGTAILIGCGNSEMSEHLLDDGFLRVISIDNSETVINQMKKKYQEESRLIFECCDCRQMSYQDNLFDAGFDKGTIDTLTCATDAEERVSDALKEIARILKPNGYFFMISFGSPVLRKRFVGLGLPKLVLIDTFEIPKSGLADAHHYVYVFRKVI